jgi:hypothetical protein
MLVHVGGDLLKFVTSRQELQSRLDIVRTAWNMSLHTKADRQLKLKRFLRKQKSVAPNKEALKGLESEIKRIIKQKIKTYPDFKDEIVNAEALEKTKNEYEIKAYFKDKEKEKEAVAAAAQFNSNYTLTNLNK